jgi:sporulation-control protein spo0M
MLKEIEYLCLVSHHLWHMNEEVVTIRRTDDRHVVVFEIDRCFFDNRGYIFELFLAVQRSLKLVGNNV